MGIEDYNRKKRNPLEPGIGETAWGVPGAGEGLESLVRGIGNWWRGRNAGKPERVGVNLYNPPSEPRFRNIIPDPTELILGGDRFSRYDKWMNKNMVRPFGKWAFETVPESYQKWNESYVNPTGPVSGDVSRDWEGQIGDIGKWLVNTPYTWGKFGVDVGADVLQAAEAMDPTWLGGEGRDLFSKEQKYQWDAAAVDKFGINPIYEDNPYAKYDWTENWTKKTNPILDEVADTTSRYMYEDFLTEDMADGIWNEIGYDSLKGKTSEEQNGMFYDKFVEKYANEWDMNWQYEQDRILKRDYDLGGKGTPGAIEEFEIGFNYDPLLPYSTDEAGFLEGSTRGLGEALLMFGGPGMFSKAKKFVPKWKKKHFDEGIMSAAKGTDYDWAAEYLYGG